MITIFGAFDDIVNAITRERERGTFPRLVLTPTSILSIYSGKISATVVLNAVRTTLMLVIFVLTGLVIRGNVLLVYLTTTLIAVFTMSLGLMLSTKIRSSATLTILEIAITFPLFQLAGAIQAPELLASGGRAIGGNVAMDIRERRHQTRHLPWSWARCDSYRLGGSLVKQLCLVANCDSAVKTYYVESRGQHKQED